MIRQALRKEKEQELREETDREIEKELSLLTKILEAKKSWKNFRESSWQKMPECAQRDYNAIYSDIWTRERYGELDEALLKEMVALSLAMEYLSEDFYRDEGKVFAFARVSLAYQKDLIRWSAVNKTYRIIEYAFDTRTKAIAIMNRLIERLSELPGDAAINNQTKKVLLTPLTKILFGAQPQLPTIKKMIQKIAWMPHWEFIETVDAALCRIEIMLGNLLNPDAVPCEQAMRRVIEMYERNLTEQDLNIPEDGAMLDHILSCAEKCRILSPFIHEKILGKIEPVLPKRTKDCKKAIEQVKKLLVASAQTQQA